MTGRGLLLLALLGVSPCAFSQAAPATAGAAVRVVTLGNSVVALDGEWKFSPGDSPVVNGAPVWAQAGFDDSHWATVDLTPKSGAVDPALGTTGYVRGWTAQGYPNLDGYAWYRLRVKVASSSVTSFGQRLWLKMPLNFDDAYQVYANGQRVGQFGVFSARGVTSYYSRPWSFPLPAPGPDGEIALAVRFYISPATRFSNADVGGMHEPPALGLSSTVRLLQTADEDAKARSQFGSFLTAFLFLLIAPLALWAWLRNRRERSYLWLFLALGRSIVTVLVVALIDLTFAVTVGRATLIQVIFLIPLGLVLWLMFWWSWFGLRKRRWIPVAACALAAGQALALFCARSPNLGLSFVPQPALHWFNAASVWCVAALGVLLAVIVVEGFRRDRTEALLAMVPILLLEFTDFGAYLLSTFGLPNRFFVFGLGINVSNVAGMLMVMVIGVLALRRFVRTQVVESLARQAVSKDLEQAQQLQQRVLVPEAMVSPHFTVETEYHPAQTVGGDFFQTLSRPDGSLLVVIGDVSGKGVSAAMLVAVLVGAIRTRADESFDPVSMLAMLNHRMVGRSGGHFATCLVAEIRPDGEMLIANAGHLSPYLNGEEMELEGSLPLGMTGEVEYSAQRFKLVAGDRLTLMTDGVVEATNAAKELFGFERTREISGGVAADIADEAQRFGQEDDITVLGVGFVGVV